MTASDRRGSPLTPDEIRKAIALHAEGFGTVRIARELGCSPSTVRIRLIAAGVEMRPAHRPKGIRHAIDPDLAERRRVIVAKQKAGATMKAIAESAGISRQRVRKILADNRPSPAE